LGMEAISDTSFSPSMIKSGTIKSLGVRLVSATRLRRAGDCLKILFLLCRYIGQILKGKKRWYK